MKAETSAIVKVKLDELVKENVSLVVPLKTIVLSSTGDEMYW